MIQISRTTEAHQIDVIEGASVTTKVTSDSQLLTFLNDMTVLPAVCGVTSPAELIVATAGSLEFHPFVPNAVPVADRLTVLPPAVAVKEPEITDFE